MTRTVQAQALFVSCLQPSEHATPTELVRAIRDSLRGHHGAAGCAAVVATEYGDHPDAAAARMRWALAAVTAATAATANTAATTATANTAATAATARTAATAATANTAATPVSAGVTVGR